MGYGCFCGAACMNAPVSLNQYVETMRVLPIQACLCQANGTLLGEDAYSESFKTLCALETSNQLDVLFPLEVQAKKAPVKTASWATLFQDTANTVALCRSASNERYKVNIYPLALEVQKAPVYLLCFSPFQEDVALTQAHHDFVSIMSHEFRTPLTSIRGFSDTILHYGKQLDDEKRTRFIKIIRDQADRLSRMVENVLVMSKLGQEQKAPACQPVSLPTTIKKVLGTLQGKGVAVEDRVKLQGLEAFETLWAEPDGLEQVLLNLLDNAAKYSPAEKPITLTVIPDPQAPRRLARIEVRDAGHGMTPEQCEKLFGKFYRTAHHMTQDVEGSGLGLYITKSLVQRMGGSIGVESEVGKGTCFWFTVPLNIPEHQDARSSIALRGEGAHE